MNWLMWGLATLGMYQVGVWVAMALGHIATRRTLSLAASQRTLALVKARNTAAYDLILALNIEDWAAALQSGRCPSALVGSADAKRFIKLSRNMS